MSQLSGERTETLHGAYEPPLLRVVGSLHGLTQTGGGQHDFPCIWKKTIGPPDYFTFIPIANCS